MLAEVDIHKKFQQYVTQTMNTKDDKVEELLHNYFEHLYGEYYLNLLQRSAPQDYSLHTYQHINKVEFVNEVTKEVIFGVELRIPVFRGIEEESRLTWKEYWR